MKTIKSHYGILLSLALFGLAITPSTHAAVSSMGPKRWAQCTFMPGKYKCSAEEKSYARGWLLKAGAATAIAAAALIGITLSQSDVQEMKEEATQEEMAYKTLGIAPTASQADVKKAYRQLSRQWHPDKAPKTPVDKTQEYTKKMQEINNAYEILKDK